MSRIEALVTPSVMRWARECVGLSVERAAEKIGRPIGDVVAWEIGTLRPSIPQARKASEIYRRPLAVFYLPEPPAEFDTLRDFRSLSADTPLSYSPELSLIIRTVQSRQEWMRDFLINEGIQPLPFVGTASVNHSPQNIARDILQKLNLSADEQRDCRTRDDALHLWINKAEKAGIFVLQKGRIDLSEARGFAICDKYAPFIYLNSEDATAARLFTLAHELSHLWLNHSGVSNLEPFDEQRQDESAIIEIFCNKIAAEAVLERNSFYQELHQQDANCPLPDQIMNLSNVFKVSEEVIARRLLSDGLISSDTYMFLRGQYQRRWKELKALKRERMKAVKGGPTYYVRKVFNNGHSYTRTVVSAFFSGTISGREASGLLDVKVNQIRQLASTAGIPF